MNDHDLTKEVLLFGGIGEPKYQREFQAGMVRMTVEDGTVRNIYVGNTEILRGIYVAVRDRNWDTIQPVFYDEHFHQDKDSFLVQYTASHQNEEIDFEWEAAIKGNSDGLIQFEMKGVAKREFFKNRIGFCVLHPMEFAGNELTIIHSSGSSQGNFPDAISPHQPFKDITEMHYEVDGYAISLTLSGDVFEMEDQRNWTDASFKTYCTPLALPFPMKVEKKQEISQSIEVRIKGLKNSRETAFADVNTIQVTDNVVKPIPGIGLVDLADGSVTQEEMKQLQKLNLDHIRGVIDLEHATWKEKLDIVRRDAKLLATKVHLEVIVDDVEALQSLDKELSRDTDVINTIFFFDKVTHVTTGNIVNAINQGGLFRSFQIGGGSRAFFAEFNRSPLSGEDIEIVTYAVNPQVHAYDNQSLLETVKAQPVTVLSTMKTKGIKRIVVGPITFKMRFNPNATEHKDAMESVDSDPRQMSLFGAVWTLGSIQHLLTSEVETLTYFSLNGATGLMNRDVTYPLYHVFADLLEYYNGDIVKVVESDDFRVFTLALLKNGSIRLLIANTMNEKQNVDVVWPGRGKCDMKILDITSVEESVYHPDLFRRRIVEQVGVDKTSIVLGPFGYACVDFKLR